MEQISTTVEINGAILKIEGGRVFARAFGTTIQNKSMHWSWLEIEIDNLKDNVRIELESKGLI